MPASSRTSRAAASGSVSPGSTWPLGRARTFRPSAVRRIGTTTTVSDPLTTTPPADSSRSVDISAERCRLVHGQPSASLRDHAGALEGGQEPAGGLPAGPRELRDVGLRRREEHVVVAGALALRLLDEVRQDRRDAALHGLEALARQPLVRRAQAAAEADDQPDGDVGVVVEQPAHVRAEDRKRLDAVDRLDGRGALLVVEHRELAEDVARPEVRQRDRAAVGVLADRPRVTGADDVARVAGVALAEHDVARGEPAGHGELGDLLEVA